MSNFTPTHLEQLAQDCSEPQPMVNQVSHELDSTHWGFLCGRVAVGQQQRNRLSTCGLVSACIIKQVEYEPA